MKCSHIAIVVAGSDILKGQNAGNNVQYAIQCLHQAGVKLEFIAIAPTNRDADEIALAIQDKYDFILVSKDGNIIEDEVISTEEIPNARIAMVVIGKELLSGQVADANSSYVANSLKKIGASLQEIHIIPDDVTIIADSINVLKDKFDFVITSGGSGSANNDVTIDGIAKALNQEKVLHPYLKTIVGRFFKTTDLMDSQRRLARIPDGARLVVADHVHMPQIYLDNIYILPGSPEIFRQRFDDILNRLKIDKKSDSSYVQHSNSSNKYASNLIYLPPHFDENFRLVFGDTVGLFKGSEVFCENITVNGIETNLIATINRAVKLNPEVDFGLHPHMVLSEFSQGPQACDITIAIESNDSNKLSKAKKFLLDNMPPSIKVLKN